MGESQEKYLKNLLENSPDGILLLDQEERFLQCSQAFLKMAGLDEFETIQGRSYGEVAEAFRDKPFFQQPVRWLIQVKSGHKSITENVSFDASGKGIFRTYSINSTPILGEGGEVEGALTIYHDITEPLRAEEDERTRVMLDATPLACTFWDIQGNLLDCNQESLNLFGVSSKREFLDRFLDFSMVIQSDGSLSRSRVQDNIVEACRLGRVEFEWMHRSAQGEWLPTEVILVRVAWRDSYRVVGFTRDLRDIKASEDRMRRANARSRELEITTRAAQVASEAKSRFLASMSHEIRTPMNAIIGMSDLMRTDNLDEEQQDFFTDIKKMSKALLQIINDVLDISKIEVGKLELVPVHFNLLELYDNICSLSRFSAETKDLEFRHSFDPEVPPVIFGDDVRIRQVITNIINNAIKYTKEGYVDFQVQRRRVHEQDRIAFVVKDTGVGIKQEDFPKLFRTFQQLDSAANRGIVGTGLGLSITKNLVTMMRGEIIFDSVYGAGSTFTVLLPLTEGDPAQVERKVLNSRVMASTDAKVLVVDDNQINRKVALAFLAIHNIHAETAESGFEAIQKTGRTAYDLVFMDHMMPGMDGVEAVRQIRELERSRQKNQTPESPKGVPIIALSANAVSGARELFLSAGMNDFISKPIDPEELNRKLVRWLPPEKIVALEAPIRGGHHVREAGLIALDRAGGLRNAGGDEELYGQLLESFKKDHGADRPKIEEALALEDLSLAHRLAHTLKSTAGLIGAGGIRKAAQELEKALGEADRPAADKLLPDLEAAFAAFRRELDLPPPNAASTTAPARDAAGAASTAAPARDAAGAALTTAPARERARPLLAALRPLLEAGNTGSLAMAGELEASFEPGDEQGRLLVRQIRDFDFEKALETLDLLETSPGGPPGDPLNERHNPVE
jgi:PAS domain S-box-containing protein